MKQFDPTNPIETPPTLSTTNRIEVLLRNGTVVAAIGVSTLRSLLSACLVSLIFTCSCHSQQDESGAFKKKIFVISGKRYANFVSERQLRAAPEWKLDQPCPPLAPGTASKIAQDYCARVHPTEKLTVEQISLSTLLGRWYYIVTFESNRPSEGIIQSVEVFVLMDGKVIPPKLEGS